MNGKTLVLIGSAAAAAAVFVVRALLRKRTDTLRYDEEQLPHSMEPVEVASEDSFPASDPPAWTGTTGSIA